VIRLVMLCTTDMDLEDSQYSICCCCYCCSLIVVVGESDKESDVTVQNQPTVLVC